MATPEEVNTTNTAVLTTVAQFKDWVEKHQQMATGDDNFSLKFPLVDRRVPNNENTRISSLPDEFYPAINSTSFLEKRNEAYRSWFRMFYRVMSVSCLIVPSIIVMVFPQSADVSSIITYYVQALGIPIGLINDYTDQRMNMVMLAGASVAILLSLFDNVASFPYVIAGMVQVILTGTFFFSERLFRDLDDSGTAFFESLVLPGLISTISSGIMLAGIWNLYLRTPSVTIPIVFTVCVGVVVVGSTVFLLVTYCLYSDTLYKGIREYGQAHQARTLDYTLFSMSAVLLVDTVFLTLVNSDGNSTNAIAALTNTGTSTTAFSLVLAMLVAIYMDKSGLKKQAQDTKRAERVARVLAAFNHTVRNYKSLFATVTENDWITLTRENATSSADPCAITYITNLNVARLFAALLVGEYNCTWALTEVSQRDEALASIMNAAALVVTWDKVQEDFGEENGERGRRFIVSSHYLSLEPKTNLIEFLGFNEYNRMTLIQSLNAKLSYGPDAPSLTGEASLHIGPVKDVIRFLNDLIAVQNNLMPADLLNTRKAIPKKSRERWLRDLHNSDISEV